MQLSRRQLQHLFLRVGFGLTPRELDALEEKSKDEIISLLFEQKEVATLNALVEPNRKDNGEVSNFQVAKMIVKSRQDLVTLNNAWIDRMNIEKAVLREKMTLFWHNHFATSVPFGILMQQQHNMLREHALGSFREMLHAVAKDPAMILYLNNQQNNKEAPNENFAREIMELFTLGRGQYTEADIKEAARAFTGWSTDKTGTYKFAANQHDNGDKTVFNKTGNWNGNDLVDMILKRRETAVFVTRKLYKEFVNPLPDESRVDELAKYFYDSDYSISSLMKRMISSDWFYDEANTGKRIASPVEWLVRLKRLTGLTFAKVQHRVQLQRVLDQVLFFPPNVAGWPGDKAWIDSTTLLHRINLPFAAASGQYTKLRGKVSPEEAEDNEAKPQDFISLSYDNDLMRSYYKTSDFTRVSTVLNDLIVANTSRVDPTFIADAYRNAPVGHEISHAVLRLASLPEFNLI